MDQYGVIVVGAGNAALCAPISAKVQGASVPVLGKASEDLDGKCTKGISPPESNPAQPIDQAPYHGYVVRCGITFTFGGLRIDETGAVKDTADRTISGLYAAGELVGGIFHGNYLGSAGLMSGSVFGRLAGGSAGKHAKSVATA